MDNQKDSKVRENKREDRRALKKFWFMMVCSGFLGMLLGVFSVFLGDSGFDLQGEGTKWALKQVGIFGSFVTTTIILFVIAIIYRQARSLYHRWDGEDEEVYAKIEEKISYALMFTSIAMILGYFFFSFGIYVIEPEGISKPDSKIELWEFWVVLFGMIYAIASTCIAQQKIVNFDKELNPEKKGSVYDINFNSKWMESSDEAERFLIYKAAYRAFRVMQIVFPVAWIISLLGMVTFGTGLFSSILILALWMAMVCTYCINSIYYTKHSSK